MVPFTWIGFAVGSTRHLRLVEWLPPAASASDGAAIDNGLSSDKHRATFSGLGGGDDDVTANDEVSGDTGEHEQRQRGEGRQRRQLAAWGGRALLRGVRMLQGNGGDGDGGDGDGGSGGSGGGEEWEEEEASSAAGSSASSASASSGVHGGIGGTGTSLVMLSEDNMYTNLRLCVGGLLLVTAVVTILGLQQGGVHKVSCLPLPPALPLPLPQSLQSP